MPVLATRPRWPWTTNPSCGCQTHWGKNDPSRVLHNRPEERLLGLGLRFQGLGLPFIAWCIRFLYCRTLAAESLWFEGARAIYSTRLKLLAQGAGGGRGGGACASCAPRTMQELCLIHRLGACVLAWAFTDRWQLVTEDEVPVPSGRSKHAAAWGNQGCLRGYLEISYIIFGYNPSGTAKNSNFAVPSSV